MYAYMYMWKHCAGPIIARIYNLQPLLGKFLVHLYFEGTYDPSEYENLNVSPEIKELFAHVMRYTPQTIDLETRFKPFIPEYIPAVGDIDAFIKVRIRFEYSNFEITPALRHIRNATGRGLSYLTHTTHMA